MAINNIQTLRFEDINNVDDVREMGELEIAGAIAYVTKLVTDFEYEINGGCDITLEEVDSEMYYCGKHLYTASGYGFKIAYEGTKELILNSVFMRENSKDTLWGYAHWHDVETDEEEESFLVRF